MDGGSSRKAPFQALPPAQDVQRPHPQSGTLQPLYPQLAQHAVHSHLTTNLLHPYKAHTSYHQPVPSTVPSRLPENAMSSKSTASTPGSKTTHPATASNGPRTLAGNA